MKVHKNEISISLNDGKAKLGIMFKDAEMEDENVYPVVKFYDENMEEVELLGGLIS